MSANILIYFLISKHYHIKTAIDDRFIRKPFGCVYDTITNILFQSKRLVTVMPHPDAASSVYGNVGSRVCLRSGCASGCGMTVTNRFDYSRMLS